MHTTLPRHEIVLCGAGHTNAHVLRMWRMQPIPDARLTCVSNFPISTYSGMLPGVLAGLYPPERMEIDLVRLCAAAGARLIVSPFTGLDLKVRQVRLADRPPIPFDVLSIGIGSVPARGAVELDETAIAIKPMQTFATRLQSRLRQVAGAGSSGTGSSGVPRIAVVGAGLGGVEITLCLTERIKEWLGGSSFELTLIGGGNEVARGTADCTSRRIRKELEARGVRVRTGTRVVRAAGGEITTENGERFAADIVLWATQAAAPSVLRDVDLPKDPHGFLLTRPTLQTTADAPVFAVGDSGTIEGMWLPKAGVYAVREAPVLWENIRRLLEGRELQEYQPQKDFLKIVNLGDGRAVAEWKRWCVAGRWSWKLKDWIDRRFMDKYQDYEPAAMAGPEPAASTPSMRCAGCGGKVSGRVLSRVLERLEIPSNDRVLLGLETPDDAAVLKPDGARPLVVTTDFFAVPLDDPYVCGRIAALNSASDAFALGATPVAALAMATLPPGPERRQEELLHALLAGGLREFQRMGTTLIGGHTIEGPQVTIGYTVLADQGDGQLRTKARLRAGDVLLLTKPLGTGVLLAAHMQARCRADWMQRLQATMLLSNQGAAELLQEFDIAAATDITGFGLAGHLLEMLRASQLACDLRLEHIPRLPGVDSLLEQGLESTLAPANRAAESEIAVPEDLRERPAYRALFDPQTSGGLLLGVRPEVVEDVLRRLASQSDVPAAAIGVVKPHQGPQRRVGIVG